MSTVHCLSKEYLHALNSLYRIVECLKIYISCIEFTFTRELLVRWLRVNRAETYDKSINKAISSTQSCSLRAAPKPFSSTVL